MGDLWGIYPNEKIIPDFIVCGKGMSAGVYPLSTCSYKPFIEKIVFKDDPFIHISTTGGSDLGCVVACEMLDIQSNPNFLKERTGSSRVSSIEITLTSHYLNH